MDRAQLQLRQRSRQGAGPDRVVQPDRPGLPAAGVEPGHQPGVHHAALAGAGRQREPAPDRSRSAASRTATARRAATTPANTRPTCSAARTSRARRSNVAWDTNDDWTLQIEGGGGAKLEPIPFYGAPGPKREQPRTSLPMWEPYPGPRPQESAFLAPRAPGRRARSASGSSARTSSTCSPTTTSARRRSRGRRSTAACPGMGLMRRRRCGRATPSAAHHDLRRSTSSSCTAWIGDGYLGFSVARRPERDLPAATRSRCCTRSAAGSCTTTTSAGRAAPTR